MAEAAGIRPIKYAVKLKRSPRALVRRQTPRFAKHHPAAKVRNDPDRSCAPRASD